MRDTRQCTWRSTLGTKHVLDAKQRARVVQLLERDKLTLAVVAERFGVSAQTVSEIRNTARKARSARAQG